MKLDPVVLVHVLLKRPLGDEAARAAITCERVLGSVVGGAVVPLEGGGRWYRHAAHVAVDAGSVTETSVSRESPRCPKGLAAAVAVVLGSVDILVAKDVLFEVAKVFVTDWTGARL